MIKNSKAKVHQDVAQEQLNAIRQQMETLKAYSRKNANEIVDEIYQRSITRNEELYECNQQIKDLEKRGTDVNVVDHTKIANKIQGVIERAQL